MIHHGAAGERIRFELATVGRIPFGVFAICSVIGAILRPNAAYRNRGFVDIARNIARNSFVRLQRPNERTEQPAALYHKRCSLRAR